MLRVVTNIIKFFFRATRNGPEWKPCNNFSTVKLVTGQTSKSPELMVRRNNSGELEYREMTFEEHVSFQELKSW